MNSGNVLLGWIAVLVGILGCYFEAQWLTAMGPARAAVVVGLGSAVAFLLLSFIFK